MFSQDTENKEPHKEQIAFFGGKNDSQQTFVLRPNVSTKNFKVIFLLFETM